MSRSLSAEIDFTPIEHYDKLITELEPHLVRRVRRVKRHDPDAFHRLRSVPGIGKVLAMTILYEIQDIHRFPRARRSLDEDPAPFDWTSDGTEEFLDVGSTAAPKEFDPARLRLGR
jgi:hypothetical protein